ncbi:MAG: ABC transporter permease [Solibacterales bacterium]|nr:ABC transporter permease [Bryobacterales bacterium]|tara:strand:- start:3618 stop:4424 length:807 start_codon:yes stop_codon:yes gene_type:complete
MVFPGKLFLQNLIKNRSLIYQLVRRDFEQRYVGSVAGWLWGIVHPLVLLGVYTFVFAYAFGMRLPRGEVTDSYPLFLFAGMLPWLLFSETLQRSSSALIDQANLIKKTVFPAEIIPLSIFLSTWISHLLGLILLVVIVGIQDHEINASLLLLPGYFLLLGMLSLGLAWITAALNVYLRDTAQVLSVVLTAWFWLTPIFLFEAQFPESVSGVLLLNPLTYVVRGYRECILGGELPSGEDFLVLTSFALMTFIAGGLFFRHAKRGFADVL